MTHQEWVRNEFPCRRRSPYRDVLIHTSFIETIIREKAKGHPPWKCAITILRGNHKYDGDKLAEIDELRKLRNRIVHDLLKDSNLTNTLIRKILRDMKKLLKDIYHDSDVIKDYFRKHYGIDATTFK